MIVRAGRFAHDSRLGVVRVDRQLTALQLELCIAAIERVGWGARYVTEVEVDEGGAIVRALDVDDDGQLRVDEAGDAAQRVRRIRFSLSAPSIVSAP